jgi:hypothetical protein
MWFHVHEDTYVYVCIHPYMYASIECVCVCVCVCVHKQINRDLQVLPRPIEDPMLAYKAKKLQKKTKD